MANPFTADEGTDRLAWLVGEVMGGCQLSADGGSALEAAYARCEEAGLLTRYDCHAGRDWYRLSDATKAAVAERLGTGVRRATG